MLNLTMSCYMCSAEYGIFRKEVGCAICGFSFCGKCCKKREISSESGEIKKQLICNRCFSQKDRGKTAMNVSPPIAHKKRMEAMKKQSYSVDSTHAQALFRAEWSDDKDKEIAERLLKLKRDRNKADLPSESEIGERLAKLKGIDPSRYKAPPIEVFRPSDKRTSIEKVSDLIKEVSDEVVLESKIAKPEDELAARLANLKASAPQVTEGNTSIREKSGESSFQNLGTTSINQEFTEQKAEEEIKLLLKEAKYLPVSRIEEIKNEEMSEEEEAEKLVEKFMSAEFDEDLEELDSLNDQEAEKSSSNDQSGSTEEFPWCILCTEDAKIRCFGCDGDLYCLRCFRECHDSLEIRDHNTCPFLPPRKAVS